MKKKYYILLTSIIIFGVISCVAHRITKSYIGNWKESKLGFSEAISFQEKNDLLQIITSEKSGNGFTKKYNWLKKEKNLWLTFNIINNLGLKRVLSDNQYLKEKLNSKDWNGLTLNDVVKKMITSY